MLVYFIASRQKLTERIEDLREFVKAIHSEEHVLARDWIEPAYVGEMRGTEKEYDWFEICRDSTEAITKADVVVADATVPSFGIGYQVALAVQLKKPTLVLRNEEAKESVFASGLPQDIVDYKRYNKKNLKSLIVDFLKTNDVQTKDMRFNFFIDRPIYNYLRWSAHKTGKTKAEILRELVEREIDRNKPTV